MALPKFVCENCEKTFQPPDFQCPTGETHVVKPKTYFAPVKSLRMYVTEERMFTTDTGNRRMIPARYVEFVAGRYTTSNPEDQYALDKRVADKSLISEDQWKAINYKPEDVLKEKLKIAEERLAKYENSLLANVKAQTRAAAEKAEQK